MSYDERGAKGYGSQLAAQPFAALISAEPIAEVLARAGFDILLADEFNELNAARRSALGENAKRHVVVAIKS